MNKMKMEEVKLIVIEHREGSHWEFIKLITPDKFKEKYKSEYFRTTNIKVDIDAVSTLKQLSNSIEIEEVIDILQNIKTVNNNKCELVEVALNTNIRLLKQKLTNKKR